MTINLLTQDLLRNNNQSLRILQLKRKEIRLQSPNLNLSHVRERNINQRKKIHLTLRLDISTVQLAIRGSIANWIMLINHSLGNLERLSV